MEKENRLMEAWMTGDVKNTETAKEGKRGRKKAIKAVKPTTLMLHEDDIQYCTLRAKSIAKMQPEINSASAFIRLLIEEDRKANPKAAERARKIAALTAEFED